MARKGMLWLFVNCAILDHTVVGIQNLVKHMNDDQIIHGVDIFGL